MEPGFVAMGSGTVGTARTRRAPRARRPRAGAMDKQSPRPRRRLHVLHGLPLGVALVAAALIVAGSPSVALGWSNSSFSASSEGQMLTLINQARAANGLPAYRVGSTLHDVARWRSKDMYVRDYFSHDIPSPPGGKVFNE